MTKNYLFLFFIFLLFISCKKTNIVPFPTFKVKSDSSYLIETWHVNNGMFVNDTFFNCRYYYDKDSTLMITFDSSKLYKTNLQIEINNQKTGVFCEFPYINEDWFVKPANGVEFMDSFSISTNFLEEILFVELNYKFFTYSLYFGDKERWYHNYFPHVNTEKTPHYIFDNCTCKKSKEKIYSKSHKEDFKYINDD